MRIFIHRLQRISALTMLGVAFTGCQSTDSGGQVSGSAYYGAGFQDSWYYGGYYNDVDIIVTPPERPTTPPGETLPPRPTHPIAPTPTPRPTPMPSIPRTPMPRASVR